MDAARREIVLGSLRRSCDYSNWILFAAHVRSTHAHAVIHAEQTPERVINKLKSHATRALQDSGLDSLEVKHWARRGSNPYLWNIVDTEGAIDYVLNQQGKRMSVYEAPDWVWRRIR